MLSIIGPFRTNNVILSKCSIPDCYWFARGQFLVQSLSGDSFDRSQMQRDYLPELKADTIWPSQFRWQGGLGTRKLLHCSDQSYFHVIRIPHGIPPPIKMHHNYCDTKGASPQVLNLRCYFGWTLRCNQVSQIER